jgi:hypothetical protein
MMGPTHKAFGAVWWLTGVAAANLTGADINPVVALTGAAVAPVFAAGRWSPDADQTWLSHLGHRRATHRPDTTAVALTIVSLAVWAPLALALPAGIHLLALAPVAGWWSHLIGDAVFGRIPCGPALGRPLRRVLGRRVCPRDPTGRYWCWVGLGWDTNGVLERGKRPDGQRVLSFAPATVALQWATVVLAVTVTGQWMIGGTST